MGAMHTFRHHFRDLPILLSIVVGGAAVLAPQLAWAVPIYVDADATGANDGGSWANAYTDLQDALSDTAADPALEIT